jgi:hypothetical protein
MQPNLSTFLLTFFFFCFSLNQHPVRVLLLSSLSAVPNKKQKQALSLTTETDTAIPTSPKKQQTKRTKTKKKTAPQK